MKSNRAFVIPVIVWWLAGGLAATQLIPNWRVANLFSRDKTAEISKQLADSQSALKKAEDDAKKAADALRISREAELQRQVEQARYSQEMVAGASESLKNATPEPAVKLAASLLDRANSGLAAAVGSLPIEKQAEIFKVVADSLSGIQAKLDSANSKLAAMDKELAATTSERDGLKKQIPVLETKLTVSNAVVLQKTGEVEQKTTALVVQAKQIQEKITEAGSANALAANLGWLILILAGLYLGGHNVLPAVAREFPQYSILTKAANAVKNATTGHA